VVLIRDPSVDTVKVFKSGEAGVGKVTVGDLPLARLGAGQGLPVARGQCADATGRLGACGSTSALPRWARSGQRLRTARA